LCNAEKDKIVAKADKLLKKREEEECRTVLNKTKINKSDPMEAQMAALAADADKRHREKQRRVKIATEIKERGNQALKDGDLTKAEILYSEALDHERSVPAFWTNRAIVRIKLKKYEEAIHDCDWAWRASNDRCPKAMSNMGHAYCATGDFENAKKCYERLRSLDKANLADTYLQRLEIAVVQRQKAEEAKKRLQNDTEKGSVREMVAKLMKTGQQMMYYQGGLAMLQVMIEEDSQLVTLFEEAGGFQLFLTPPGIVIEHPVRDKWINLDPKSIQSGREDENEMVCTIWRLMALTTADHADRADEIINDSSFPQIMIASLRGGNRDIRNACLSTTFHFSTVELLRTRMVLNLNRNSMLPELTQAILNDNSGPDSSSISLSMQLIANLSRIPQFRKQFRNDFEVTVCPTLIEVLENCDSIPPLTVGKVLSALTNMVKDVKIRQTLVSSALLWPVAIAALDKLAPVHFATSPDMADLALNLVGLLHNLSFENHVMVQENAQNLAKKICRFLQEKNSSQLFLRALGLFGNLVSRYESAALVLMQFVERLMAVLKNEDDMLVRASAKCLAAMSEKVEESRKRMFNCDPGLKTVGKLLENETEEARGNGALIISNCCALVKPEPIELIYPLLQVVDNAKSMSVRKNAAIAVSKLSQDHPAGREELRKHHGIEILTSRLKSAKI